MMEIGSLSVFCRECGHQQPTGLPHTQCVKCKSMGRFFLADPADVKRRQAAAKRQQHPQVLANHTAFCGRCNTEQPSPVPDHCENCGSPASWFRMIDNDTLRSRRESAKRQLAGLEDIAKAFASGAMAERPFVRR